HPRLILELVQPGHGRRLGFRRRRFVRGGLFFRPLGRRLLLRHWRELAVLFELLQRVVEVGRSLRVLDPLDRRLLLGGEQEVAADRGTRAPQPKQKEDPDEDEGDGRTLLRLRATGGPAHQRLRRFRPLRGLRRRRRGGRPAEADNTAAGNGQLIRQVGADAWTAPP